MGSFRKYLLLPLLILALPAYSQTVLGGWNNSLAYNGGSPVAFSAAGVAIPTCNSNTQNMTLIVSDATLPATGGVYSGGGSFRTPVFCNGTNWLVHGIAGRQTYSSLSYQPGLITSIVNTKSVYSKVVQDSTVDNIIGSAQSLTTCTTNPTITMYNCHADASCATSPTTIGSSTITATGQAFTGTVSNSAIAAGEYVAFAISGGACASLDIGATAQVHTN